MIDIRKVHIVGEMLEKMLTRHERAVVISEIMCQDDYDANDAFKVLDDGILAEQMKVLGNKLLNPIEAARAAREKI